MLAEIIHAQVRRFYERKMRGQLDRVAEAFSRKATVYDAFGEGHENLARMIRKGHEMGITILTAVDSGYGPESVYRVSGEINAFIDFGMTPLEALQSASIRSAEAYGLADRTGAVEAGLEADLVVFDRNPLEQPSVLHNPLMVMSNGRVGLNRHAGDAKVLPNH